MAGQRDAFLGFSDQFLQSLGSLLQAHKGWQAEQQFQDLIKQNTQTTNVPSGPPQLTTTGFAGFQRKGQSGMADNPVVPTTPQTQIDYSGLARASASSPELMQQLAPFLQTQAAIKSLNKPDLVGVNQGETLYDTNTRRPVFSGAPKGVDSQTRDIGSPITKKDGILYKEVHDVNPMNGQEIPGSRRTVMAGQDAEASAAARAAGFGDIRQYPVIDTKNGNTLQYLNANDINVANKKEPGRYVPQSGGAQALSKESLIEDIRGNIQNTRDSIKKLGTDFLPPKAKAAIAFALTDRNPRSSISALMTGGTLDSLTPQQQDYVQNVAQLTENAMAMRGVLGAGQGSEDLRNAIRSTIPGATTPNSQFALGQLDKFESVLNRLLRGVPNVPLRGGATAPTTSKFKILEVK